MFGSVVIAARMPYAASWLDDRTSPAAPGSWVVTSTLNGRVVLRDPGPHLLHDVELGVGEARAAVRRVRRGVDDRVGRVVPRGAVDLVAVEVEVDLAGRRRSRVQQEGLGVRGAGRSGLRRGRAGRRPGRSAPRRRGDRRRPPTPCGPRSGPRAGSPRPCRCGTPPRPGRRRVRGRLRRPARGRRAACGRRGRLYPGQRRPQGTPTQRSRPPRREWRLARGRVPANLRVCMAFCAVFPLPNGRQTRKSVWGNAIVNNEIGARRASPRARTVAACAPDGDSATRAGVTPHRWTGVDQRLRCRRPGPRRPGRSGR